MESTRLGTVFASNVDALRKWHNRRRTASGSGQRGLTGEALERAVMNIGSLFPGQVIRGTVGA